MYSLYVIISRRYSDNDKYTFDTLLRHIGYSVCIYVYSEIDATRIRYIFAFGLRNDSFSNSKMQREKRKKSFFIILLYHAHTVYTWHLYV